MRHGVILAGGGGTRLWPASRRQQPKQFLSLGTGDSSLLWATLERIRPFCADRSWVVTAADQVEMVQEAVPTLRRDHIVAEPSARNTAAALALAALHLVREDPDAIMAALPSDQHIADVEGFGKVLDQAFEAAENDEVIVTVGIVPTRPETGYGYLHVGAPREGAIKDVLRFVEKPDRVTAQGYLDSGDYLWNAGMFICKAQLLLDEIERHMPESWALLAELQERWSDESTMELYPQLPSVSIDYGVMEKSDRVVTIPADVGWNDVGSWSALEDYVEADGDGNVSIGACVAREARGNITVADEGCIIALAGVQDLVVVQSGNAVLVLPKDRAQDVRKLVDALKEGKLDQYL